MKIFRTKLSSSIVILIAVGTLSAWAKPIAQVQEVKGIAFVVTASGTTKKIQPLDIIDERAEVLVEEGAQVSLSDYYNVIYHLSGGTHIKFYDRSLQLKKGKTWVKSQSKNPLAMTTANGNIEYSASQFIATFDQLTNRSQVLVVQGDVNVSNILDQNLRYTVNQGNFTVIDPEIDDGLPRAPTQVGMASLTAALEEFRINADQTPLPQVSSSSRSIASVTTLEAPMKVKRGEIIFISSNALPQEVVKKVKRVPASLQAPLKQRSGAPARISYYGISPQQPKSFSRLPASAPSSKIEFTPTLKKADKLKPNYSNELESLLFDLKSY